MPIEIPDSLFIRPNPDQYILSEPLRKAAEMALAFNQPLLLTGEPGTGKTLLAYKLAAELSAKTTNTPTCRFASEPLRFDTKTTSTARDLFYTYDAIGHFQHANIRSENTAAKPTSDFIELQALGKAIALANPRPEYAGKFRYTALSAPQSSVVLVDEVDKAPRDFTNDILNEIERQEFFIKEQDNFRVSLGEGNTQRILVIMTSNSEKNLPDAFLRRCVFYHIDFPDDAFLLQILKAQVASSGTGAVDNHLQEISKLFGELREAAVRKPPATAELVGFVKMLEMDGLLQQNNADYKKWFEDKLSLLLKTREDIEAFREWLKK